MKGVQRKGESTMRAIWDRTSFHNFLCMLTMAATTALTLAFFAHNRYIIHAIPLILFALFAFAFPRVAIPLLLPMGLLIPIAFEWNTVEDIEPITAMAIVLSACIITAAFGVGLRIASGRLCLTVEHIPIAGFGGLILLGYLFPPVVAGQAGSHHFPGILVCLLMLAMAVVAPPKPEHLLNVFVLSAVVVALFSMIRGLYLGGDRLHTVAYLPTVLGIIEGPAVVACLGLARVRRDARWLVPATICFSCVVAAQARAGMLAVMAGVVLVLMAGRSMLFRVALLGAAGTAVALFLQSGLSVGELLAPGRSHFSVASSDGQRSEILQFSLQLIKEHPLRGVGYENLFQTIDFTSRYGYQIGAHNDFIRIAAENGIPALAVFVFILFRGLWSQREGDLEVVRAVAISCMAWIGTAVELPHPALSVHFWISLACMLASRKKRENSQKDYGVHLDIRHRRFRRIQPREPTGNPLPAGNRMRQIAHHGRLGTESSKPPGAGAVPGSATAALPAGFHRAQGRFPG